MDFKMQPLHHARTGKAALTSFKDLNKLAPGPFFQTPPIAVSALASTDQYPAFRHARLTSGYTKQMRENSQHKDVHEHILR